MKGQKKLAELPWPEKAPELGGQHYLVEVLPQEEGRVLEIRFYYNRNKDTWNQKRTDFRVFLRPADGESVVQVGDKLRDWDLNQAMHGDGYYTYPRICYPEISPTDEAAIASAIGEQHTGNHQMDNLDLWLDVQIQNRKTARRRLAGYIEDEVVGLCPGALPEGLEEFIRTAVLPNDHVLLYKRGNVRGTCYHCGQQVRAQKERFRQDYMVTCPNCGEKVTAILEHSDRWSADYVDNIAFLQRGTDGGTVFIRLFHLLRDPAARYERLERFLQEAARYAIRGNSVAMWVKEKKEHSWIGRCPVYRLKDWERSTRLYAFDGGCYFMERGWQEAVAGTRLQYACLHDYQRQKRENRENLILYLLHFARYPVMEFLWKAGYQKLVAEKVRGLARGQVSAIRWTAPTVKEAFRFPMRLLRHRAAGSWEMWDLVKLNAAWAVRPLSDQEAVCLVENMWLSQEALTAALPYATVERIRAYLSTRQGWQRDYRDYLGECVKLGLDLNNRQVLFPADLLAAHARTARMVEYETNKAQVEAFCRRAEKLQKWAWEQDGLLIRPAASHGELKAEGTALSHCVASYATQMARGETDIFLIRRADAPDKSYFTLELRNKKVVQCRTAHNVGYEGTPEVAAFVEAWLSEVVNRTRQKKEERAA